MRFMALFDARDWVAMEACVTPGVLWQRPDVEIVGLAHLRQVLLGTAPDIRVRHVISNLRASFTGQGHATVESYFTVYRHVGALAGPHDPAPLQGPASVGRYEDKLVEVDGAWRIARRQTIVDFRRVP